MKQETITHFLSRHLDVKSKSGFEWYSLCPFHQDSSPSFSFNIKKGLFICYACGEKGNTKKLVEFFNGGSLVEEGRSDEEILDSVNENIEKAKRQLFATTRPNVGIKIPDRFLNGVLKYPYWTNNRKLTEETIKKYELGYDDIANEAIIPLKDVVGRTLGLIRRSFDPHKPRYLYPKGMKISQCLFGVDVAYESLALHRSQSLLVITEGSVDAMALHQVGFASVALLGSRISDAQVQLIKFLGATNIIIATDNDRAGRLANMQVAHELKNAKLGSFIRSVQWSSLDDICIHAKDIAEILQMEDYSAIFKLLKEAR